MTAQNPMPVAVAALARTRHGIPVPWVADWRTHDDDKRHEIDPEHEATVVCDCVIGSGRPLLGVLCETRQRRAATEGLCGVCGQRFAEDEPRHFVGGSAQTVYREPPVHTACGLYAARACPAIRATPWLGGVWTTSRYHLIPERRISPDGYVLDPVPPVGVLAFFQMAPSGGSRTRLTEWTSGAIQPASPTRRYP